MTPRKGPKASDGQANASHRRTRAVVFGEVLFDHFPDGSRVLGGAPFNVAWHLCGFGGDPFLLTRVGEDDEAREILDQMESWGMSTGGVGVDRDHPTGTVVADTSHGDPSYQIVENQAWDHIDPGATPRPLPTEQAGLVYHGSLALRSQKSRRALRQITEALGVPTFVDLNLRAPWWTRDVIDQCIETATWVKLNADELSVITGRDTGDRKACAEAARNLRDERDIPTLVVTRGTRGSLLVTDEGEVVEVEAPEVSDLVDTVGAGDAFSAVFCHGILQGWEPQETLQRASAFAAEACRVQGATATDLSVYEAHLRRWAELPRRHVGPHLEGGLYVLSLSVHGLLRGRDIELGRDADTGGQVSYAVDQARALTAHPDVGRVDLVTRLVEDRRVDDSYAQPREDLGGGARIVRLPFGPRRYLHKESLWPYLDTLLDQLIRYVRTQGHPPDVIHSHYADAGYVGAQLAKLLGVPFVFTGHSLGRVKKDRLMADGADPDTLEERYHLTRRIEAEEQALETAALVITSTSQEVRQQYESYDHYEPQRMEVIPPGVDLTRFSPPSRFWPTPPMATEIHRFLDDPDKPMILALARADDRKNFQGLLHAYATTPGLRDEANLVIIAGNREDIRAMDPAPRRVLTEILMLVDRYDLYGHVAYPKHHAPHEVPDLYRLAARSRGIFVNPALTEPFGLTLIEAASSGLPVVATNDGGPQEILERLEHGLLADPLDPAGLGRALLDALADRRRWARWSKNGVSRVHRNFSWQSHARRYVREVGGLLRGTRPALPMTPSSRLPDADRMVVTDVDDTLTGDDEALEELRRRLEEAEDKVAFGIATGRSLDQALELLEELDMVRPDALITGSGSELHYGPRLIEDRSWERQIRYRWDPEAVIQEMEDVPGLRRGSEAAQTRYRLRYELDPDEPFDVAALRARLRSAGVHATPIVDHGRHLDIVPVRASPGLAIRFFCYKWNVPPERVLVAGDSGNDKDMLSGETLGVVVGNHTPELEELRDHPRVYFAEREHAWGVVEGLDHYDFLGGIRIPEEEVS